MHLIDYVSLSVPVATELKLLHFNQDLTVAIHSKDERPNVHIEKQYALFQNKIV